MDLKPGDRYTIKDVDGAEHHDTVHTIRYRSAEAEIRQRATGWRRVLREFTPKRWRKPLPIVRPYRPADVEVIGVSEVGRRAQLKMEDMLATVNRLVPAASQLPRGWRRWLFWLT